MKWPVGVLFLFPALVILSFSSLAAQDNPPFDFPLNDAPLIPGDRGMAFFYGVWAIGGGGGGGPMTVTDRFIAHYESDPQEEPSRKEEPYRILYTAPDYVFFINQLHFPEDFGGGVWTDFGVFILQRLYDSTREPGSASMRWYSCTDARMKNAEAFDWPDERVLAVFHERCGRTAGPGKYLPLGGDFWSSWPYYLEKAD